jgi:hypothetical protein
MVLKIITINFILLKSIGLLPLTATTHQVSGGLKSEFNV